MAIDGNKIIQAVMIGNRIREEKGIIPIFGVYLSLFFVQYYNRLSFDFEKRLGKHRQAEAAAYLIQASQECGYATFHGLLNSWEWEKLVQPMIERKEDNLFGFTSVALAAGWGDLEVKELVPNERLVIQVKESYESTGYLQTHGLAETGKCFMLCGVTAAFMDILYGDNYPDGCQTFLTEEPLCRAKGDHLCEFLVQKKS